MQTDLTDAQLERYARHVVLDEVGEDGQIKLLNARVLVVGAGGLGSPLIQYLAAAGVGRIGIVDDDTVDISNLQRQTIHRLEDVGRPKAQSAADFVQRLNPEIKVDVHATRLTEGNATDKRCQCREQLMLQVQAPAQERPAREEPVQEKIDLSIVRTKGPRPALGSVRFESLSHLDIGNN